MILKIYLYSSLICLFISILFAIFLCVESADKVKEFNIKSKKKNKSFMFILCFIRLLIMLIIIDFIPIYNIINTLLIVFNFDKMVKDVVSNVLKNNSEE